MSSRFAVYVDGGEGCDYTMDCNKKLYDLRAGTMSEALVEAEKYIGHHRAERPGMGQGEGYAVKATVLQILGEEEVDIQAWLKRGRDADAGREMAKRMAAERAEYERLKAKFND